MPMTLLSPTDAVSAEAISRIGYVNPFLPERIELERQALGPRFRDEGVVLRPRSDEDPVESLGNVLAMRERAEALVSAFRLSAEEGGRAGRDELLVYERLVLYLMYSRYMNSLDGLVSRAIHQPDWEGEVPFWEEYQQEFHTLARLPGHGLVFTHEPSVILAGYFQIERAFTEIYHRILGGSMPAARLRAAVWESIFTRDMGRYLRVLHRVMVNVPTLIVGPSGSGKELVARAVGLAGFIPFNPGSRTFEVGDSSRFVPLNLSALAPTLIESELFGHKKGSFTGAATDRVGWLKTINACGAVFLDEIGELDPDIQVKLLRLIETRTFHPLGDTVSHTFSGKILAATHRDLGEEIRAGRFRHDLYYRLCADQIVTPSLAEQLDDCPEDLPELVQFIAWETLVGRDACPEARDEARDEVERLSREVVEWVERELEPGYAWPGNFRELGQCVRNVMVRGRYRPSSRSRASPGLDDFCDRIRRVGLTADQLLGRYYAWAFHQTGGSYTAAAEKLGVDWRVVKRRLDHDFLDQLRRLDISSPPSS